MSADHSLLFGLLAIQNGLIDQAQLVSAFQAWVLDKGRSLADLLVERGAISPDDRAALEALVQHHLRKHGDAERSLASLPIGPSTHQTLTNLNDPDLGASLAHVSRAAGPDTDQTATYVGGADRTATYVGDSDQTAAYSVGSETSDGQRFLVLRPHARGGLGAVFVALDSELNREVALKQILDHHADNPTSRGRFVVEAEVTGGLEHPGIVPVYGMGAYADGRPFYAMRFIRGDSLRDAIASFHADADSKRSAGRYSLALHKLLRRFLDVCNALEYAHARGVLHRDIKPGNIIVGKYGETLVVDWGLARATGKADDASEEEALRPSSASGSGETLPGSVLGTPAYMSPEQARGDLDALGPRSDVYSLGATLYCLLTGRPPFQSSDAGAVLGLVRIGRFPPPRQVLATVPPALEAICLKAMATAPEQRYASCRALADDVERWLADESVSARREPLRERASRWLRKHPVLAAATAATLLVGLAAALYSLRREQAFAADLKEANTALDTQKQRAEAREKLAIDAVKQFADAVTNNPDLKNNPALDPLRKTLLKEPLEFFQALRERLQTDNDTRPESLARLAAAAFDLGQLTSEIGDKTDALRAFEESRMIWGRLVQDHPAVTEFQSGLATSHHDIGLLLRETGEPAEALAAHEQARAILEQLVRDNPTVAEFQSDLALSHNGTGLLLRETGKPTEALAAFEQARAIQERLAWDNPTVTQFQSDLADTHNNVGVVHSETGRPAEALAAFEQARAIRERLARDNPTVTQFQNDLAASHNNVGVVLSKTGKPAEALAAFEQARAVWGRLAWDNPTVTQFQNSLAKSLISIGSLLNATGKPTEALAAFEQARAIQERLASDNPTVTQFQSDLAASHDSIANLLHDTGKPAEALAAYEQARAIQERLASDNPTVTQFQNSLAASHNNIGLLLNATGKPAEALVAYEQARAIQERLASDNPTVTQFQSVLANSHNNIGNLLLATGKPAEALATYEQAWVIQERLAREHPESPDYASVLGGTLNNLAALDLAAKRFAPARDRLREAIAWQKKALAAVPQHPQYRRFMANHLTYLLKAARGLNDEALAAEAQSGLEELRKSDPQFQALDARLAAVRNGEQPSDNPERLALAQRAYDTMFYATAARLWAEALKSDPNIAADRQFQHPYNAACAASLAASGQGKDEPAPDDAAKIQLRRQALGWLNGELTVWEAFLSKGPAQARPFIAKILRHWQEDADLASIRNQEALEQLSEAERDDWQALWSKAKDLLQQAEADGSPPAVEGKPEGA